MGEPVRVADLMSPNVRTVRRNDHLLDANELMRNERIRHLVVLDEEDKMVGILSQRDLFHSALLRALGYGSHGVESVLRLYPVKEAMHTEVISATPDERADAAGRRMLDHRIGCLPVVDHGKLVGILTETDFLRHAIVHLA